MTKINDADRSFLILVFATIFLASFGVLSHNAFADSVVASIPVNGAWGVATNPNTNLTYVATGQGYQIQVINGATNMVVANVTTASVPAGSYGCNTYTVAVNPTTNMIYANNVACVYWPNSSSPFWIPQTVSVINGSNNQVIATVHVVGNFWQWQSEPPKPIAVNPTTNEIYVLGSQGPGYNDVLSVINGTSNQIIANTPMPDSTSSDITINPQTDTIYVLDGSVIRVIDGKINSIVNNISWGKSSNEGISVNPTTNRIYVSNSDNTVSVIDGSTYQVMATVQGTTYGFVGVNTVTDKIYVSSPGSTVVSVIDGATNSLVGQVVVGQKPYGIGVDTATNEIYVGNSGSGTMSVISGGSSNTATAPSAPQSLQAVPSYPATGSTYVTLSWSPPTPNGGSVVTNYKIYKSQSSGTEAYWSTVGNVTSWIDTGAYNGGTFFYKVTAINSLGESVPSNEASAIVEEVATPTGLHATTVSSSQINLSWTEPNYGGPVATGYMIERYDGVAWSTIVSNTGSTATTFNDTALAASTTYTYRISAINSAGTSSPSNLASATTQDPPATSPHPPTGLTDAALSSSQINLSWTTPSNNGGSPITGYKIERSTDSGTTWSVLISNTGLTATTYSDTGLAHSTTYTYRVSAINSAGTSSPSNTVSATTFNTVPSPPTGLTATAGTLQINLSWNASSDNGGTSITGYMVERSTDGGNTWSTISSNTGSTGTTYSDTNVLPMTAYTYRVSAINGIGTSAPSNTASTTIGTATTSGSTTATVPSSPTGLTATAGNSQASLSWTAPSSNGGSAITSYNIYRGITSGSEGTTPITSVSGSTLTYTDTGLTNGQTYFYKVTAVNSVGVSSPSNEANATPTAPTSSSSGTTSSGIVLNNVQSTSGTTSSSNTITLSNFNAGSGSNQLLVVGISANNQYATSITFNGVPLTQTISSFNNNDAEFWYLKNPSGTGNVVVTMAGSTQAVVGAYSFSGVSQTSPIANTATNHNTASSSPTVSITTQYPNDWVLDLPSIYGGVTLGSPTCTQQWDTNMPSAITGASSSTTVSSPGPATCSWTASNGGDLWDDVAVEIGASK